MIAVLSVTLPVFVIVALGFASTRLEWTNSADIRSLGAFVIRFALPALIFKSLSQRSFTDIARADFLAVYTLASLAAFGVMFALARALRPGRIDASAIQALGSSASNSGFVGYPIALLFVGPSASLALALAMITENVVVIPLALTIAESANHKGAKPLAVAGHLAGRLALNPLIVAIALGAAASISGLTLPQPLAKSVDMLAAASGALALFAVGGALVGLQVGGVASDVARIVSGKLLLHPLLVFGALRFAPGLDPGLRKAMLILASSPMLSIYPLLGRPFGQERVGAAALMTATALSFVTISALLIAL